MSDERDERAMEKIASAMEQIATALTAGLILFQRVVDREYPIKPVPRDATITHVPSDLDKLKEDQGATDETTEEWLGTRERQLVEGSRDISKPPKK